MNLLKHLWLIWLFKIICFWIIEHQTIDIFERTELWTCSTKSQGYKYQQSGRLGKVLGDVNFIIFLSQGPYEKLFPELASGEYFLLLRREDASKKHAHDFSFPPHCTCHIPNLTKFVPKLQLACFFKFMFSFFYFLDDSILYLLAKYCDLQIPSLESLFISDFQVLPLQILCMGHFPHKDIL